MVTTAEHTCMDKLEANTNRFMESIEKSHSRTEALFEGIMAKLEILLQRHNLSTSSLHGAANSNEETVRQPCQLKEEIATSESLNTALPASEKICSVADPSRNNPSPMKSPYHSWRSVNHHQRRRCKNPKESLSFGFPIQPARRHHR